MKNKVLASDQFLKQIQAQQKKIQSLEKKVADLSQAEESLKTSEKNLSTILNKNADGIIIVDTDGIVLYVNPAAENLFGKSKKEFIGYSFGFPVSSDKDKNILSIKHGKEFCDAELRVVKVHWQKKSAFQLSIRDITELKRTESILRKSEEEFRSLAEAMPQIVWITRPDGWNIYFNQQWADYTGLSLEESFGHGWNKPFHPDDQQRAWDAWQNATKNGAIYSLECRLRRADGVYNWWLIRGVPILDASGAVHKWFGTCTDINEIKRTEEALIESENRYRRLFEAAKDGIIILDAQTGVIIDVNPFLINLLGYSHEQFLEKSIWDIGFFKNICIDKENFQKLRQEKYTRYDNKHLVTADGRKINIEFVSNVYLAGKKEIIQLNIRDITERKHAEETIYHLASIVKSSDDAIISKTLNGIITSWNRGAEKIYGYKEQEVLGKSITILFQPGHDNDLNLIHEKIKSGGHYEQLEAVRVRKDGHEICMSLSISPILNAEGHIIAISTIGQDITERKQSEEKIKFQAHLLGIVGQAVIATDQNGIINYWNRAAFDLYGWTQEEVIGKNIMDITVSQTTIKQAEEIFNALLSGKSWSGEFFVQKKGGTFFPAHVSDSPVLDDDGNLKGIIGVSYDITERNFSEDALKKSEEKFRLIMENSADAIFIADQSGKYVYTNKAVTDMLGFSAEEMKSKTVIDMAPEKRRNEYLELFKNVLITGKGIGEIELLKNDGTFIPTDLNASILPDGMIYGSCRDISERIKTQKELELHHYHLEELVKERTEELKIAKEKAEEANMAKSRFLANMSHEIRTPMNAVLGFSQLMLRDPSLSDKQIERLNTINRSGENLLLLLNDILEISKIEAGKITITNTVFDLYGLLDDLVNIFQLKAEEKQIKLTFEISEDTPRYINTDETKLRQILINLVGNAMKFTLIGGISIRTKIEKNEKVFLVVEVEDTGIGISKIDIERLFKVFEQTNEGSRMGGTGLGLALSRHFAQQLGGDVYVESEENTGSTFSLKINISLVVNSDFKPTGVRKYIIGLKPGQKQFKVLVVDDQIENRKLLSELLHEIGLLVIEVSNGQESIDKVKEYQPDMIFMDINMPVMGGLEAVNQIRHLDHNNNVPIIAVTASVFEEDKQIILKSGFNGFVNKPFRDFEIFDVLESVLGVEFLYREETLEKKYTNLEIKQLLMKLPEDLVNQIIDFATKAEIKSLHSHVNEASKIIPEIGPYLQQLVKEYKYDVLIQLLLNRRNTHERTIND